MNPRIEAIKQATLSLMEILLSNDQDLSNEEQEMIADLLIQVANKINQIKEEESGDIGQLPQEPDIEPAPHASSNINSFGYDEQNGRLLVKFQGDYPQQNGPVYAYGGVPKVIFDLFQKGAVPARTDGKNKWGKWWKGKVPSLGASMFTLIKNGGYPYQKLS